MSGKSMRSLLMISFHFPPTGGPAVQRVAKFVKYLPEYGWRPYVLAIHDKHIKNYPRDESLIFEIPSIATIRRMKMGNLCQIFLNLIAWMKERKWGRGILRCFLVPDYHILWARKAIRLGLKIIAENQVSVIYTTDPASAHWVGCQLHRKTGLPWVMDIRDLWTHNFTYRPISYIHGLLDRWIEQRLLETATSVICVTEGFKHLLSAEYSQESADKFFVITNGYDEDDFKDIDTFHDDNEKFILAYIGSLYDFAIRPRPVGWKRFFEPLIPGEGPAEMVRTPRFFLKAISELLMEQPKLQDKISVQFIGTITSIVHKLIREYKIENVVELKGYLPHREAIEHMVKANVLFLMQAGKGSEVVVPGKLYEYLRAESAILGLFPEGEATDIIRISSAGAVIAPDDVVAIKLQLTNWLELWKLGKPLIQPSWKNIYTYSREKKADDLANLLSDIIDTDDRHEVYFSRKGNAI